MSLYNFDKGFVLALPMFGLMALATEPHHCQSTPFGVTAMVVGQSEISVLKSLTLQ